MKKNIYLLKANGSVLFTGKGVLRTFTTFDDESEAIAPGDTIVVPTDLNYQAPLDRVSSITSVVFQSFSSIAAFLSISNR